MISIGSRELSQFMEKAEEYSQLPLLHDVGKAISVYLRKDRRSSLDRRIFQHVGAPQYGPQ